MTPKEAQQILLMRNKSQSNDNEHYQKLRQKFLDYLSEELPIGKKVIKLNTQNLEHLQYDSYLKTFEMYLLGESKRTNPENYNYLNKNANTRFKLPCETTLEVDKVPQEQAIAIICEVCNSLIRNNYHFFVWYAKGQRSPHIRIYDLHELNDLNPQQQIKAQVMFWRKQVPFGCFQYVDTGMFVPEHELQLEYAPHWKYGTIFDLVFEWRPKCKA